MFDCLLFDLDGTLTDSFEGVANCILYALEALNRPLPEKSSLRRFMGPPLHESFMQLTDGDTQATEEAVQKYRERYSSVGLFENSVYDGIPQLLQRLKHNGKHLLVATSKPEAFAKRILDKFELSRYFDFIAGASFDTSRDAKHQVIAYALKSLNVDKEKTVMIGDRKHDVIGAKQNGLKSIGVLYGYGNLVELTAAGADYIAKTPNDIIRLV